MADDSGGGNPLGSIMQLIAGLGGDAAAAGTDADAVAQLKAILSRYSGFNTSVDPQLLAKSDAGSVTIDPSTRAAQMAALDRLQEASDNGGLTMADRAAQNQMLDRAQQAQGADYGRLRNQMESQHAGGSGAELAMALNQAQGAAQSGSRETEALAAQSQQRALDALMKRGQLAGGMRSQDFDETMKTAEARDAMARYNAAARERAQQQQNQMRMWQTQGEAGGYRDLAANDEKRSAATRNLWNGLGAAGGQGMNGMKMPNLGGGGTPGGGGMDNGTPDGNGGTTYGPNSNSSAENSDPNATQGDTWTDEEDVG